MPRRNESFDKYLSEQLQDPELARELFLSSIEDFEDSVEDALKYTIQKMGLKEFSTQADIPIQNVSQFINGKRNLKQGTLDKYLSVFGLKSKIIVVEEKTSKSA